MVVIIGVGYYFLVVGYICVEYYFFYCGIIGFEGLIGIRGVICKDKKGWFCCSNWYNDIL